MTLELNSKVRKCLSCNWTADTWDIYCSVDKSHSTREMWQYLDRESMTYTYSENVL